MGLSTFTFLICVFHRYFIIVVYLSRRRSRWRRIICAALSLISILPASAFNLVPLVTGLIQSLGKEHKPIARKAVWISIASGLMPALCIFITFDNSPLVTLSLGLFVIYGLLAIGFAIILKIKRFDRHVM